MSVRSISTLALGLLVVLAGCSDDGRPSSDESTAQAVESSSPAPPSYSTFADYPGEEMLYTDGRDSYRVRVKAVEAAWLTELAGTSAQIGSHYLAVYVVVTGELADRGVEEAYLNAMSLGLRFGSGDDCVRDKLGGREASMEEICHDNATLTSYLWDVPYRDWGTYEWEEAGLAGIPLDAGETAAGVVAFTVRDDFEATDAIEFCGGGDSILMEYDNCIAVPAPKGARS
ncbi:hypothetical protein [Phytomonospora endophytica]|uniref:Lipoprotein n=1 Tax=Phytomonospora endophytica TaxID=714109 RepID=A0A841FRH3_9ACTN|nr:hypothetical protein [Phytomonospora endophytica]MBB6038656.1 hypothetical protein [Phytomonospora endophytica]GIG69200.1 hypothetical protein Pen01_54950 [Phytomonospora endophytica]